MNNCAHWLVEALQALGVDSLFGYPGGAIMPVYDALYTSPINHYLCRHEQGCGFAAIGYARSHHKLGVCLSTSGPGATNLITPLADAHLDSVPLLAITGQVSRDQIGTDAFQEVDLLGLSLAVVKHSFLIASADELPEKLWQAVCLAQNGRPGPVLLDLPKDVQLASAATLPAPTQFIVSRFRQNRSGSNPTSYRETSWSMTRLESAVQLLDQAQKPVVYLGGGVAMANAVDSCRILLNQLQTPTVTSLKGIGCAPPNAPYFLGMLGMHGWPAANKAVQEADLLLVLGARFDDRVTGLLREFAPQAKVIHLDIDPAELGKRRQADVSLAGDLAKTLPLLSQAITQRGWAGRPDWLNQCLQTQTRWQARLEKQFDQPHDFGINPVRFLGKLQQKLGEDSVVTCDVGQHQMWVAQHLKFTSPNNHLSSGGLGTMGFGLPAALGAQVARPDDLVVAVCGDGSFMMNIQELVTLKRYGLPVKIIIFDNQRLGMVKQWQQLFFESRFSQVLLEDNPDFVTLARACDIAGLKIERQDQVDAALDQLIASEKAFLLHLMIPQTENIWPLVPPGKSNDQMMTGELEC